jgi:uncharacterized protein YecE (DUF72 family)
VLTREADCASQPSDRCNYLYRIGQLEPWADRVRTISDRTRSTYVVTNNHFEGKAVVNAFQLTALLTDKPVERPEQLVAKYPQLNELTGH